MILTEIRIKRFEICFCCLGYFSFAEIIFLYNERPCCEKCYYLITRNEVLKEDEKVNL